jgi:hypothetical protein
VQPQLLSKKELFTFMKNDFFRLKKPDLLAKTVREYISSKFGADVDQDMIYSLITDADCMNHLDDLTEVLNTVIGASMLTKAPSHQRATSATILSSASTPCEAIKQALENAAKTPPQGSTTKKTLDLGEADTSSKIITPLSDAAGKGGQTAKRIREEELKHDTEAPPAKRAAVNPATPRTSTPSEVSTRTTSNSATTSKTKVEHTKKATTPSAKTPAAATGGSSDRRNGFQKRLHRITSSPSKYESEPFFWALLLANVLMATKTRRYALTQIQFGYTMEDPRKSLPVLADLCLELVQSNLDQALGRFFKEKFPLAHPATDDSSTTSVDAGNSQTYGKSSFFNVVLFRQAVLAYLSEHDVVDILSSISGITSPKNKTSDLIGFFRDAALNELRKCMPELAKDPAAYTSLTTALKAPRKNFGGDGTMWKQYCLNVALKCIHEQFRAGSAGGTSVAGSRGGGAHRQLTSKLETSTSISKKTVDSSGAKLRK